VPRGIALAVPLVTMIRKLAFLGSVIAASVYLADKTRRDKVFGKARPMIDNVKDQLAKRGIGSSNSDVSESDSSSRNLGSSGLGSSSAGSTTRRTPSVTSTSTTRGNGGTF
jgi:hypothetical protein